MSQTIFLVACVVLAFVPLYFVVNSVYQDGVIGRGALLAISFCSIGFLLEAGIGASFYLPPLAVALVVAFAVFISWHLCRFHRRVVKKPWQPTSQTLKT